MRPENAPITKNIAHTILREIIKADPNTLRTAVATEALTFWTEDPREMFENLAQGGCQSGAINSLIYYQDTHQFFDNFYDEIEDIRTAFEDETGAPFTIQGDLKNTLAWFAFEETAFTMAREDLGLDL